MTKYEIELSKDAIMGVRTMAYAINKNLPNTLLPREKQAVLELVAQLPPPLLPDGVYVYRGDKYLSTHFVKDGKHSCHMEVETGFMPFAMDVLPATNKDWTRIGDLPDLENNG